MGSWRTRAGSFLISYRGGDSRRVGYVSAGFWAGITLGRFLIVYPAHRIGEKIVVGLLVVGAIAFQLMTWLIPNIIGEAVSVAILGLIIGSLISMLYGGFREALTPKHATCKPELHQCPWEQ
ncbi:hypothetical protein BDV38DRAFT_282052 [Aspergillus pseudotamarii]|uniref:Major facilitator superfamily domain-containing protein n=1 Tax=Aspergillus pseudotamarii TaxID=132259 RepID=A0A5N6SUL5_ASPPS|nr:uncharacterized protein BDV38DRAFT_282052 [Aspergillus pseudotamarii]KAE8138376.1 hypothetical protein BDV38DRAFT_282052 [Aspergillus pseudotamarii]